MIASRVHAVIAAGLANPGLLARWQREPDLLRSCGVEPSDVDLGALWKFAGLAFKIRHNGLRGDLPLTFRLLNVAGLEIEVFASYASDRACEGGRYAHSPEARGLGLLTFLERWLDFDKRQHVLIWDLIRHELALARLRKIVEAAPTEVSAAANGQAGRVRRTELVPRICGEVVLHVMRSDPQVVASLLREKSPALGKVSFGTFHLCYWLRRTASEIHILQLDELGFYLLSFVNGNRSIADLSRELGGSRRPERQFLHAVAELEALGILAFA